MMDAVMYNTEAKRMCVTYEPCGGCGAYTDERCLLDNTEKDFDPEEAVRIVEEWSKAHPKQTNADKFKEVFGKDPIEMYGDLKNDYGDWFFAPYEAPKGADNDD